MLKIGVTGGIGGGKSTICRVFAALGVPIYDSDASAKWLMVNDQRLVGAIKVLLGEQAYTNAEVNRNFVADRIFNDKRLLRGMNAIVHPAVIADFLRWTEEQYMAGESYVVHESALLFESGLSEKVDYIITVSAPIEQRVERTVRRDGVGQERVRARVANQMDDTERENRADFVIDNGDGVMVLPQVMKLHEFFWSRWWWREEIKSFEEDAV